MSQSDADLALMNRQLARLSASCGCAEIDDDAFDALVRITRAVMRAEVYEEAIDKERLDNQRDAEAFRAERKQEKS